MSKIECKICDNIFINNHSLSMHLKRFHNFTCEEYYLKYVSSNNIFCSICGNKNNFISLSKGFNTTCSKQCGSIQKQKTNLEKYGFNVASKHDSVKIKTIKSLNEKYGNNSILYTKFRQKTMFDKYGVKNPMQINQFKEKSKKTCNQKYGVNFVMQNKKICEKSNNIRRKNGTLNTSKQEEKLYEYLLTLYPNTKRNYKSDLYPYLCDFYIPEKDLYIELNAHWTHGKEAFNPQNISHLITKCRWKKKNTEFYDEAIKTWTVRDVKKRKIAKENNLNYLEIFTNNPKETIQQCIHFLKMK